MFGSSGRDFSEEPPESTELLRRHGVWGFPAVLLLHAMFVYGVAPRFIGVNLVAVLLAFGTGIAFRWARDARWVLATAIAFFGFTLLYLFGIVAPLSYLALIDRQAWIPAVALSISLSIASYLFARVRSALRDDWSKPLEQTPEVHIATNDWILSRAAGFESKPANTWAAVIISMLYIAGFWLLRGGGHYLVLVMMAGPVLVAFLSASTVAQWIAFFLSVRDWERRHGIRLRFSALPRRAGSPRKRNARRKRKR